MAVSGGGRWRRTVTGLVAVVAVVMVGLALMAWAPPSLAQQPGQIAVVSDPDGLNLRAGPGTEFQSLGVLPQGTELTVLGPYENGVWLPVSHQGRRGFVHSDYVQIRAAPPASAPTATPTPSATPTPAPTVSPSVSPAASPSASPSASPATSGSPPPSSSPTPSPSAAPPAPLVDNGVLLHGVFASDWDEMITIADEFNLVVALTPPAGVTSVTLRLSGAPFLSARASFDVQPGMVNWLHVESFRVDTENEPVLREELIRKVGGTIPIRDGALALAVDYKDAVGADRTASFQPTVYEFNRPSQIAKVEYPDVKRTTGLPPRGAGDDNFYLRGDLDFHHPDDFYVRKLAVEMGRRGGIFSDDPELVADNVFLYINSTFGDAEPGDFNNDYNISRLMEEGTIVRGRSNGGYICIGQTYLMTAMTRTLGLPSREMNLAVGRANWLGNDGVWRVTWWQEGAIHVWYNGGWHHYDLWLGFKGMSGYFNANLAYQAWTAFDRRAVPFVTIGGAPTGLGGHNFAAFPGNPPQWEFVREATKPGYYVEDMPDENGDPVSGLPDADFYRSPKLLDGPEAPPIFIASPPPKGILNPPVTRP